MQSVLLGGIAGQRVVSDVLCKIICQNLLDASAYPGRNARCPIRPPPPPTPTPFSLDTKYIAHAAQRRARVEAGQIAQLAARWTMCAMRTMRPATGQHRHCAQCATDRRRGRGWTCSALDRLCNVYGLDAVCIGQSAQRVLHAMYNRPDCDPQFVLIVADCTDCPTTPNPDCSLCPIRSGLRKASKTPHPIISPFRGYNNGKGLHAHAGRCVD